MTIHEAPGRASAAFPFLAGGGKISALIAAFDWAATPLGSIEAWPHALKTTVGLILNSPVPIVTLWGEDGMMIYNDAYSAFAGGRHPALLGSKVREGWPEVADFNDNVMKVGLSGRTLAYRDQELTLHRNGAPEQVWMNLDYSPIPDESGAPIGVIAIVVETSQKVRAERWLNGERERLQQMFEQAPGFFAMLSGPRHVFDLANPAYMQLIGHRQIIGLPVREALPELEGQGFYERLDEVFKTGEAFTGFALPVSLRRTADSLPEERFLDFVYQPVRNAGGAAVGIVVQGTDVTDRVLAERDMRASEARFSVLAQAMPNQVWTAQPDGMLDWFNDLVYSYSGAARGQLDGQAWTAIVHPDDIADAGARWARALASGDAYETQFRLRRADGLYRWHIARALPIRDADGRIDRWIGANTDIEDQKMNAQALAHLNETLAEQVAERTAERDRIWSLSRDLLVVIGPDGIFRAVNPAWKAILGHEPEEVVGRSFRAFVHPDDAALTQSALEAAARDNLSFFENRYVNKDGSFRWISWHTSVEGRIVYAYGRDVTGEKEQAEALRQAEEALRQSQKMEAVGQLTGGLAHDFNNLLTGITGSLELLQTRVMQGRANEIDRYISAAQGAAKRAAALTHRLLAFSRRQTLDPKPTNATRLVNGMEELIRRTVGPEIKVEVVGAMGLWTILADASQLESALLNLCINGRDAMQDGGRLTVETGNRWLDERAAKQHDLTAGQYVSLCVSDTGTGMTPEVMARAFDPFFTTKPIGMGTGLGLSMIYGFAKQSGGHVRIYSEVGQGTMVCIYLPRHHGPEEPVEAPPRPPEVARAGKGETVLIVDDEPTIRMLVIEVLEEMGYSAIEATDGPTGLKILQSDIRIDLLITDVGLPGGLNGRQIADAGRQVREGLKVLFITGYAENAAIGNGFLAPGMQVLTKPFTMDDLARRLKDIIAGP